MEVKEADASSDGHRNTTLSHIARPSSESVVSPSGSAPQHNPPSDSPAPLRADEAMEVKEADASNDGHCATTLFHSARPSTESVMPPSAPQRDSPPPVILPTAAGSSDLSDSSVASPSSEIKDSSSPHQPRLVVTAPLATPNPYALLDDEGEEKIASNDVQRASVPASSARPSRVETASSADSKVAARVYGMEHRFRLPIKPVVAVDESPVNKRPCTRARPATTSTHGFAEMQAYYWPCYEKREREKLEKHATEMEKEDRERRWGCLLERTGFVDRG
jgi:hypothetical protein